MTQIIRRGSAGVLVGNVKIGDGSDIVIQSMTNTDTAEVQTTAKQIIALAESGAQIVRITVNNDEAAKAVPRIKEAVMNMYGDVPIVGCFHYNGHDLLERYTECALALDKYRINPGNIGFNEKRDINFEKIINIALKTQKPIRIGVNWGSLDKKILDDLMNQNSILSQPKSSNAVLRSAIVESAIQSALFAEKLGMPRNKIVISAKCSKIEDFLAVYRDIATRCEHALHIGLTEAGIGVNGIVSSAIALGTLLQEGIGDTIRCSITPSISGTREQEVDVCISVLQALGLKRFAPVISSCPGCGRTTSSDFQRMAEDIELFIKDNMPNWRITYPGVEKLNIAVMGCIVNGPGESKYADIGISLPGNGEAKAAPVFIDGHKAFTLRGSSITEEFKKILVDYIAKKFQH